MGALDFAPSEPGFASEVIGAAVVALHNLAVHRLLSSPVDAVVNVVTAAGLTAFAKRAGCSRDDLGIRATDAPAGLRLGLAAAAVATGGVALAASLPATRPLFRDRRAIAVGRHQAIYDLVVRIPLATAVAEELTFRGALLGLARHRHSPAAAVGWTSLLFGASHALPTLQHYDGNPASGLAADPSMGQWVAVLGTTLSTAGAGCLFAWLPALTQPARPHPGPRRRQRLGLPGSPMGGSSSQPRSSRKHRLRPPPFRRWRGCRGRAAGPRPGSAGW